jgi:(p)ppGpp synthase/HD superfamily hydrolase
MVDEKQLGLMLKALRFAAEKHQHQRRKNAEASPYINHPIQVADLLWDVGQVRDLDLILAALLHDTIEDTDTRPEEIETLFGKPIRGLVEEVTDDTSLPKAVRKQLQIEHASRLSLGAKLIKLADKISNIGDIAQKPPEGWDRQRRVDYLTWSEQVVAGLRGSNLHLEALYDRVLRDGREKLRQEGG